MPTMRTILGLLLALALAVPVWPQAQPKPAQSLTPQATAQDGAAPNNLELHPMLGLSSGSL
jgi:uncharacterized membrane protein YccC